jgi:hypothetical protein
MPSTPQAMLGSFDLPIRWPITVTAPERTLNVSGNALSILPVQTNDYVSNFGTITFVVVLKGIETEGETAADHLARQIANLKTEIASDNNTFTVQFANATTEDSYTILKNKPPTIVHEEAYATACMALIEVELTYSQVTTS